jgi:DNA adenine methylase
MTSPIKWLGSKKYQLEYIIPKLIDELKDKKVYQEPFVGGGSVIIELLKRAGNVNVKYKCYDSNEMLIAMYNEIKHDSHGLIKRLQQYLNKNTKEDYYRIRDEYNEKQSVDKFIYLNKTCFRGLYSVNKNNIFNSSFGHEKNPRIFEASNILTLSKLFNDYNVLFIHSDYRDVVYYKHSVIYLDPVYYKTFDKYTHDRFCYNDYLDFLEWLKSNNKISIIHSNSTQFLDIYSMSKNETVEEIEVYNRIKSNDPSQIRRELLFRLRT